MFKKSFYIFLTALLGAILFLVLDRIIIFVYLYLIGAGVISGNVDYLTFVLFDYFGLILSLFLGLWYGIWLGLGWFNKVYEEKTYGGCADYLVRNYWPKKEEVNMELEMEAVKQELEDSLTQFEKMANVSMPQQQAQPQPMVRKVVRKRAPKKLKQPDLTDKVI